MHVHCQRLAAVAKLKKQAVGRHPHRAFGWHVATTPVDKHKENAIVVVLDCPNRYAVANQLNDNLTLRNPLAPIGRIRQVKLKLKRNPYRKK